jgi:hypothetical protein
MRRGVAIAATLAGVCLLEGLSKFGGSPTELIYADGRLGDVPGFNEEAQMQWKSGEVGGAEPRLGRRISPRALCPASNTRIHSLEIRVQCSRCHLCACHVIGSRPDSPRKDDNILLAPPVPLLPPLGSPMQVVYKRTHV